MLKLLVSKLVFNPALLGKPVYLEGYCQDGDKYAEYYLVKDIQGDTLILNSQRGKEIHLSQYDFKSEEHEHGIEMTLLTILEVKKL